LLKPRIISDLELARFGYQLYPKDPAFFTVFPDGRHLFFWQDGQKTHDELARFSARDAAYYHKYEEQLVRMAEWVEGLLMTTPPNIIRRKLRDLIEEGLRLALEASPKTRRPPSLAGLTKRARGMIDSGVTDLASNPKHLAGFGRNDRGHR